MEDVTPERWLPVAGYIGCYEVSDKGRVKSLRRRDRRGVMHPELILRPARKKTGHLDVSLSHDGIQKTFGVHRLVMLAFIGPPPAGQEVRHGPNGVTDNSLSNLCYGTRAQQKEDMLRDGTQARGERVPTAKLTEAQVSEVRRRHAAGEPHRDIAAAFNISRTGVTSVVSGRTWASVPGASPTQGMRPELQARGERTAGARLTEALVLDIRRRYAGGETQEALAAVFGVSRPTICQVVRRASWTHLPPETAEEMAAERNGNRRKRGATVSANGKTRGECPACGCRVALRVDGTATVHHRGRMVGPPCSGSGQPAADPAPSETVGALADVDPKPPGVTEITGGHDPLAELVRLVQEMGLYDEPPRVCVTHGSVQICRRTAWCEWSADPGTVKRVMREQLRAIPGRPDAGAV